jgi:hypothetical protein
MWRRLDLALRFVYVALVPFFLAMLSNLIPITGIVIGTAIATIIALFGAQRWRARVGRIRFIGGLLAGFGQLGEYYAENPPKPLLYYVIYPVLVPHWLFARKARREFMLYRSINLVAIAIIAVSGIVDYFDSWKPLPFSEFFGTAVGSFFIQLIVLGAFVMPIVTTVLMLHSRGNTRWLIALVLLGVLTAIGGVAQRDHMKGVPFDVAQRIRARLKLFDAEAHASLRAALDAADASLRQSSDIGIATQRAREVLDDFYRSDEAAPFKVWTDGRIVLLYVQLQRNQSVWIARDGEVLVDTIDKLPAAARDLLEVNHRSSASP